MLFSYGSGGGDLALAKERRLALEALCAGRDMTAITQVRASGMIYGLQAGLPVRGAAWSRLRRLPTLADRVAALGDADFHAQLIAEAQAARSGIWDVGWCLPKWRCVLAMSDRTKRRSRALTMGRRAHVRRGRSWRGR